MTAAASPSPPLSRLTPRQEEFCQAMAAGVGGAEAARRAGYSPNGAKQRGAFLMRQPEIRLRIDAIRASRRRLHQTRLDEAEGQIAAIIDMALEAGRPALALRAVELRLRLCGVIQDKRIAHHYQGCRDGAPHPDADLENLAADPQEELDFLRTLSAAGRAAAPAGADDPGMTKDDLSEEPAPAEAAPVRPAPRKAVVRHPAPDDSLMIVSDLHAVSRRITVPPAPAAAPAGARS
ncbi:terminase small subunit (plasmid) [Skermanella rosea]|uniref:terminase small subunit n=1 Tax=Skermanella rosea TaxID=1817965 RepID=UPI0019326035|nr:terminase small subunit [Skermanella rosea]UEM07019.1 terminase small subunit [Skermanella rosea]